mgnify:CR=1 FL=1
MWKRPQMCSSCLLFSFKSLLIIIEIFLSEVSILCGKDHNSFVVWTCSHVTFQTPIFEFVKIPSEDIYKFKEVPMGKVIAFANQKGGVGKSTLTVQAAFYLRKHRYWFARKYDRIFDTRTAVHRYFVCSSFWTESRRARNLWWHPVRRRFNRIWTELERRLWHRKPWVGCHS